jgi:hypothetical protein
MVPKNFSDIGIQIPEIWLPTPQVNLSRWAVIACDQYTSQPEYWHDVETWVGKAPSTLNLVLPEVYLDKPGCKRYIERIHRNMDDYLAQGLLQRHQGMVYVERLISGRLIRRGLLLALDLEQYDYQGNGLGLIRATEGTIVERLPPRINVRRGSALELPHIMVLIDDIKGTVHDPVTRARRRLKPLYDFELPFDSGHLSGWLVDQEEIERGVVQALRSLAQPEPYAARYSLRRVDDIMLFAVGDGNHSFAAAKAYWEELKQSPGISLDHPARYALVEVVNLQDDSLCFEPIHRVMFGLLENPLEALKSCFGERIHFTSCFGADCLSTMVSGVDQSGSASHAFGVITPEGVFIGEVASPGSNLPVGTLQFCLDSMLAAGKARRMDYVHGADIAYALGSQPDNAGFYLPPMPKEELFRTVILDGALSRKTFSMGEAQDKRFYMESRKIVP